MRVNSTVHLKLIKAKSLYAEILIDEKSLLGTRDEMLIRAWKLGSILTELKEDVGHGKWLFWLGGNWPELGERNAQRCMALFRDNKHLKNADSADLAVESVRKFMWGYIPAKERLQLDGDREIKPGGHHLTVINQFSKYDRQLRSGQINGFKLEEFRRDFEPMVRGIIEIGGRDWVASLL